MQLPKEWERSLKNDMGKFSAYTISSVQSLSRVWFFATPWTAARQASLSFTISQSLPKLMSIESVMPSNQILSCYKLLSLWKISHPLSSPSPPAFNLSQHSGSFPVSQLFTSCSQIIGVSASASVLPMNIQDWFPLSLTGLISLQSKVLSRVFSNTTVQKHQFFGAQPLPLYPLGNPKGVDIMSNVPTTKSYNYSNGVGENFERLCLWL